MYSKTQTPQTKPKATIKIDVDLSLSDFLNRRYDNDSITISPVAYKCFVEDRLSCVDCAHKTFDPDQLTKHSYIKYVDGAFFTHNNGMHWCLGTIDTFANGQFKTLLELVQNCETDRVGPLVTKLVNRLVFKQLAIPQIFLAKIRGALLTAVYYPVAGKAPASRLEYWSKFLRLAPRFSVAGLRVDPRVDLTVLEQIPAELIPRRAGRLFNYCLQELCFLASISKITEVDPMLAARFSRVDSIVEFLYSRKGLVRTSQEAIFDWIDARANEIEENYRDLTQDTEPLVLLFQGEAGAGKTTRVRQICEYLGIPKSEVYWRQTTKHWDGYCGQLITVFDDLFQGADANRLSEFVNVVNSERVTIPMASIEQKGAVFSSPIVVVTANALEIPRTVDVGAILRRFSRVYHVVKGQLFDAEIRRVSGRKYTTKSIGVPTSLDKVLTHVSEYCYGSALPKIVPFPSPVCEPPPLPVTVTDVKVLSYPREFAPLPPEEEKSIVDQLYDLQQQLIFPYYRPERDCYWDCEDGYLKFTHPVTDKTLTLHFTGTGIWQEDEEFAKRALDALNAFVDNPECQIQAQCGGDQQELLDSLILRKRILNKFTSNVYLWSKKYFSRHYRVKYYNAKMWMLFDDPQTLRNDLDQALIDRIRMEVAERRGKRLPQMSDVRLQRALHIIPEGVRHELNLLSSSKRLNNLQWLRRRIE